MFTAAFPSANRATITQLVDAYRAHYDLVGWRHGRPYVGVLETIESLKRFGLKLFLATNKPAKVTEQLLAHSGLGDFFAGVGSVDVDDPEIADKAALTYKLLADHKLDPAKTAFVGDTANDACAASANLLDFIWATYGYGAESEITRCGIGYRRLEHPSQLLQLYSPLSAAA